MLPASIWTLGWRSHSPTGAALPGKGSCCVMSAHVKTQFNTYVGLPPIYPEFFVSYTYVRTKHSQFLYLTILYNKTKLIYLQNGYL
jgi:hypothetical protein